MAPPKPKADQGEPPQRLTRASAKRAAASSSDAPPAAEVPEKKAKKARGRGGKQNKDEKEKEGAAVHSEDKAEEGDASNKTIVVEHCKQCNSFKTRANLVKDGIEKADCGVRVVLNPEKPRRGCFEIRLEGGKKFISLLDMKRPFKPMKDLDMDKVISDIIADIKD